MSAMPQSQFYVNTYIESPTDLGMNIPLFSGCAKSGSHGVGDRRREFSGVGKASKSKFRRFVAFPLTRSDAASSYDTCTSYLRLVLNVFGFSYVESYD